ncbi:MAG: hypothetical protein ACYDAP_02180, partial [Thermoplasmataceae archaeon]
ETSQSGILEGELETDLRRTVPTGCWDIIKLYEGTALALYSTYMMQRIWVWEGIRFVMVKGHLYT